VSVDEVSGSSTFPTLMVLHGADELPLLSPPPAHYGDEDGLSAICYRMRAYAWWCVAVRNCTMRREMAIQLATSILIPSALH